MGLQVGTWAHGCLGEHVGARARVHVGAWMLVRA